MAFFKGVRGMCVWGGGGVKPLFPIPKKFPCCLEIAVEMNNIAPWSCFPMAL